MSRGRQEPLFEVAPYPAWRLMKELERAEASGAEPDPAWEEPEVAEEAEELLGCLEEPCAKAAPKTCSRYAVLFRQCRGKIPADLWLKLAFLVIIEQEEIIF